MKDDIMKKYEQFGINVLGNCAYCGETVFSIEDRFVSKDRKSIIHARCAEPAQIQDAMSKLEDIEE